MSHLLHVSVPGETSKWSPPPQFASDWCSWTLSMFQWSMPSKWVIICIMKWPIAKDSKSVTYVTLDGCHTCKLLFGRHGHNMYPIVMVEPRACLGDQYLQNEPSYAPGNGRCVIHLAYPTQFRQQLVSGPNIWRLPSMQMGSGECTQVREVTWEVTWAGTNKLASIACIQ
jgi:hypothetical protein